MSRLRTLAILLAAIALVGANTTGVLQAEPPVLPRGDGAPGEGEAPRFLVEPPAQPGQNFAQAPPAIQFLPDVPGDDDGEGSKLDDLDKRAPVRKGRQSVWTKAESAAGHQEWDDALRFLAEWHEHAADDDGEDSLVRLPDGTLQSGRLAAARLLLQIPDEQRGHREDRVGGRARIQLDLAVESGALIELSHTASRFFGTLAGYEAANRLATQLLDSGDYGLAARWMILLRDANAPLTRNPAWQNRARLVLSLTGLTKPDGDDTPAPDSHTGKLAATLMTAEPARVTDWLLPGGNAARHARTSGGKPVLFPRWSVPTISSARLGTSVDELIEDIAEQRETSVLAASPIYVDGKLISRTVRGIEVIDVDTGRRLWTTAERSSVERMLDSASTKQKRQYVPSVQGAFAWRFAGPESSEPAVIANGPLSQFLFQNAAQGLISSNGRFVYSIEDDPVLTLGRTSIRNSSGIDEGPEPGSATSNRLTASDLQTGRIAWQVGGPESSSVFSRPLAGLFFMGAPVPAGDDLFVVAMKQRDVRLYCLDPETGESRWSQLLAFADHTPDRDLVRRIWSVQPAVAHGVVVCPTSVGWLVGIDRSTGTLLWTYRYAQKKRRLLTPNVDPFGDGLTSTASESLNSRWATTPPIVAGRRVYVTPAESKREDDPTSGMIVCLDLFTGKRVWQKSRGQGRYLAGVVDGHAVVVENDAVVAYSPTGRTEWDVNLPRDVGAPSGRGVIAGNTLWLPTHNRALVQIELTDGRIVGKLKLPENSRPLGNLAMYRGKLISQHPAEFVAFEQATALEQRLAAARLDGRHDPQIALLEARLALSNDDFERAINVLKLSLSTAPAPDVRDQLQTLLSQAILSNLEEQPETSLALIRELESLSGATAASLQHRQLAIEVLLRTGHPDEALARLLELEDVPSSRGVRLISDPHIQVSQFVWLRDRVATAWQQLTESRREAADALIIQRLADESLSPVVRSRRARLFAFHPAASALHRLLAQTAQADGRPADAEFWLNHLAESADENVSAQALVELIELQLKHFIDHDDLAEMIGRAESLSARTPLDTALTDRVAKLRDELEARTREFQSDEEARWQITARPQIDVTRSGGAHGKQPRFCIDTVQGDPPAGSRYRVEISSDGSSKRLLLFERSTGKLAWSVMLRSGTGNSRSVGLRRVGSLLFVLHRSVLHCVSIADRRLLWANTVELPDSPLKFPKVKPATLKPGTEWVAAVARSPNDPLPVANSRFVVSRGRKTLTVFHALTGQVMWRLDPAPRTVRVEAHGSRLYLLKRNGDLTAAFNAISGRALPAQEEKLNSPLVRFADRNVSAELDEAGSSITVTSQRDGTDSPEWSHEFESDFAFGRVGRHSLAIMRDRGYFAVLDLQSGQLLEFDRIPASLRIGKTRFQVLKDERRWYVVLSGDTERDYRAPSLKSAMVSGHVLVFDAATGKLLWKRSLSDQFLITDRFASNPVLLVLSPSSNPLGVPSERLGISVLSKSDGEQLFEQTLPGMISVHSMRLDHESRMIELFASGDRIRLSLRSKDAP